MGEPGSPYPRPQGDSESYALTQGDGETRFPHTPARGRVWEGCALLRTTSSEDYDRRAKNWCTISVCRGKARSAGAVMITRASASRLGTNGASSAL